MSPSLASWLADVVLLLHFTFVLFVVLGGLLVLKYPRLAWVHLPVALWGIIVEWIGFVCPLTPLENALRRLAGGGGYRGGFIEHYITAVLYPDGLTRPIQIALGGAVLAINAVIYWRFFKRRAG